MFLHWLENPSHIVSWCPASVAGLCTEMSIQWRVHQPELSCNVSMGSLLPVHAFNCGRGRLHTYWWKSITNGPKYFTHIPSSCHIKLNNNTNINEYPHLSTSAMTYIHTYICINIHMDRWMGGWADRKTHYNYTTRGLNQYEDVILPV